uniref:uncharacterized protein LOC122600968 n=1 Tax=Erigeron canadensis TaxID=72917 RepID=UPI001CB964F6|nr:uncharacterized protein LOC122600968 [Erigeron canadensis]
MEQHTTLFYTNTTEPMSNESQRRNQSRDYLTRKSSMPAFAVGNVHVEDDIEDEESEFKMGRLIRQASLNSSQMAAAPQQITKKAVMTGSSSLPRYPSQNLEVNNQEKISNMRKYESMKERSRSKNNIKMSSSKNMSGGPPTIPGGWADKGLSEDIKAQIKFWARAVAFNVHQEC